MIFTINNISPSEINDKVEIIEYKNNKVVLKTISSSTKLLVLTDTYYPGWQVLVDNQPNTVIRVDHAFRGVVLDGGEHKVEFIFRPKPLYYGIIISLMTLLLTLIGAITSMKYFDKSNKL